MSRRLGMLLGAAGLATGLAVAGPGLASTSSRSPRLAAVPSCPPTIPSTSAWTGFR
jgi:hypothetical protein